MSSAPLLRIKQPHEHGERSGVSQVEHRAPDLETPIRRSEIFGLYCLTTAQRPFFARPTPTAFSKRWTEVRCDPEDHAEPFLLGVKP